MDMRKKGLKMQKESIPNPLSVDSLMGEKEEKDFDGIFFPCRCPDELKEKDSGKGGMNPAFRKLRSL